MSLMIFSLLVAILNFGLVGFNYKSLPEKIATHFDINGDADGWGSKKTIWLLPIIGLGCLIIMFFATKTGNLNIPKKVDPSNAHKMLEHLTLSTQLIFCLLSYLSIQVALEKRKGLGSYFMISFAILIIYPFFFLL